MNQLVELWEKPVAEEIYMIAGWQQWADAGSISSGLPHYLIEQTGARKIGEFKPGGFYLFQIPGTHHFLRPEIKLEEGYRKGLTTHKNELFYSGDDQKGLVIFLGEEPHLNETGYAEAFFEAATALKVKRIGAVGGVYGSLPYDKERDISCTYSLPGLKTELAEYAVRFSNYEGGSTIGSYLLDEAEKRLLEYFVFYAFVPAYDFSQVSAATQGIRIDNDFKAWYDIMRRFNHMFGLNLNLSDLQERSDQLLDSMNKKVEQMEREIPQLEFRKFLDKLAEEFTEHPFMPLADVWEQELGDLFDDLED